jgi:AcrR family transcriptional regulator
MAKLKAKGDETRARIMEVAMELFQRQGFDAATMRAIAAEAGVATGAAYYYFDSKDAIVLAFYQQSQAELEPLLEEVLAGSKDLKTLLRQVIETKLRYFEPNRRLLTALTAHTDPGHSLSPFSPQTQEIRERDMHFFSELLERARVRVPEDLRAHLPRILWMYQMGLIMYWVFDRSPAQKRTAVLLEKSLPIVTRLIQLAGLPLMRPVRRMVVDLVEAVVG